MFQKFGDILTVEEMCEALRIGKTKAYEMLKNHDIKAFRNGRKWVITREELERFVRQKE